MFTVQEIAERLKVSPATIYDAVASGELPHHRIGRGRGTIGNNYRTADTRVGSQS
jgi:excisionase family DNA binding protein